tara:strand:+ start:919 stop:1737 length:819 start_codon:yes stop_codon:yes gene_type:complete
MLKSFNIINVLLVGLSLFLISMIFFLSNPIDQKDSNSKLVIFSAISLEHVMREVISSFESEEGIEISINYGGSQRLARQIGAGANADIFLSAGMLPRDFLNEIGVVKKTSVFASNRIVFVSSGDFPYEIKNTQDILNIPLQRIAIGNPNFAPVGVYAKDMFEYYNIWEFYKDKIIYANNAADALRYVKSGNVDLAIVYDTDVKIIGNDKIRVFDIIDERSHRPIVYTAVEIADANKSAAARDFITFLLGNYSKEVLKRKGFEIQNLSAVSEE